MEKLIPLVSKKNAELKPGNILLAKPFWMEEQYRRSVILIIQCEEGHAGIIINKPSNLSLNEALPELEFSANLYYGGGENDKTISYLHTMAHIPGAADLGNGVFWGGDYDWVKEQFDLGELSLSYFQFCAGFVLWKPGQLEREIDNNGWWVSEFSLDDFLNIPRFHLWSKKLVEKDHLYGLIEFHPDPVMN